LLSIKEQTLHSLNPLHPKHNCYDKNRESPLTMSINEKHLSQHIAFILPSPTYFYYATNVKDLKRIFAKL